MNSRQPRWRHCGQGSSLRLMSQRASNDDQGCLQSQITSVWLQSVGPSQPLFFDLTVEYPSAPPVMPHCSWLVNLFLTSSHRISQGGGRPVLGRASDLEPVQNLCRTVRRGDLPGNKGAALKTPADILVPLLSFFSVQQ